MKEAMIVNAKIEDQIFQEYGVEMDVVNSGVEDLI